MRNLSNEALRSRLTRLGACLDSVQWLEGRDLKTAWAECPRVNWLFWLAGRSKKLPREKLVLAACACARTALKYLPAEERRPLAAIEAAEKWARGEATLDAVRTAADAADAADASASAANAASAASAAYAADAASASAARAQAKRECANIVRGFFSYSDL